jgi:hypothetical protein
MRADFIRQNHGERAAKLIRKLYARDSRLTEVSRNAVDVLADLCYSHVWDAADLQKLDPDRLVGLHAVNLRFLAVILRLADILDFDRERTPRRTVPDNSFHK